MKLLKVGGYLRVSTEEQAALVDGSLDNQRYRINAFVDLKNVQEKNWGKIVDYYVDDGYSAKDTRRPAFQKMMNDLRKGKVDLILVTDLSRLSRNIPDFCDILELLKEHEASFLSIKEQFDSSTPAGKMMLYNMINLAQFEREQTAERVALGCHARAMRGLLNGGQEILGFDKLPEKKNTYAINEKEAKQVGDIFDAFLECSTLNRTIRRLEEFGIRPKRKQNRRLKIVDRGIWTHQTLGALLKNMAYIGIHEVNRKNKDAEPRFLKSHEQYQVVKATWPAIVKREKFDAVQKLLEENKEMERRRLQGAERRVFLVSGLIKCKECGRPLVGQSAHGQNQVHRYYMHQSSPGDVLTCSVKRIRAEEVENAINRHVSVILKDGNYLEGIAERIAHQGKDQQASSNASKNRLKKEIRECEAEMEAAYKLQIAQAGGSESMKFVLDKLESLGKKKTSLEKTLTESESSESNVISLDEVRRDLEDRVNVVTRGWAKLPAIQKRRALRRLIQQLYIGAGVIDIFYYSNALVSQGSLEVLSVSTDSTSSVPPFRSLGTQVPLAGKNSKSSVSNCRTARMVTAVRIELTTPSLGNYSSVEKTV